MPSDQFLAEGIGVAIPFIARATVEVVQECCHLRARRRGRVDPRAGADVLVERSLDLAADPLTHPSRR